MGYKDDKIKILEMICSHMMPSEIIEEDQEVTLKEIDLKQEGFSFNGAVLIVKELFGTQFIKAINITSTKEGQRIIILKVPSQIDGYTKLLKYPETEYEDYYEELASSKTVSPSKIFISIDVKKGIYREDNETLCYKIKSGSKRVAIISYLIPRDKVTITDLAEQTEQYNTLIIKEIKEINLKFREKLNLTDDLIIHIPTGGYSLNKDKFDIKTSA